VPSDKTAHLERPAPVAEIPGAIERVESGIDHLGRVSDVVQPGRVNQRCIPGRVQQRLGDERLASHGV